MRKTYTALCKEAFLEKKNKTTRMRSSSRIYNALKYLLSHGKLAGSIIVIAFAAIYFAISAKEKISGNASPCRNLSADNADYKGVEAYLHAIMEKDTDSGISPAAWMPGVDDFTKSLGNEVVKCVHAHPFKLCSIQFDESSGNYLALGKFGKAGTVAFLLTRRESDFRLISVDFFS